MADKTIPTTINNYPVVAYIGDQGRAVERGVVVVYRNDRINNDDNYVVWFVKRTPGTDQWDASVGRYDLSYQEALVCMATRVGIM